jgi:hypothetical protein
LLRHFIKQKQHQLQKFLRQMLCILIAFFIFFNSYSLAFADIAKVISVENISRTVSVNEIALAAPIKTLAVKNSVNEVSKDREVKRAIAYGFVPVKLQSAYNKTITYAEFCQMLTNLIKLYDESKVPNWRKKAAAALKSSQPMQRDDGALAIYYAAEAMGLNSYKANYDLEGYVGTDSWWGGVKYNYPQFPNWSKNWVDSVSGKKTDQRILDVALLFVLRRISSVDGSPLFDFDQAGLIHFGDPLTRKDAIKSALRLYESDWKVAAKVDYTKWCSEQGLAYFSKVDNLRKEIRNTPTKVTYSGEAYYVSNSGSDANDGKSPAAAWATVKKVNSANLSSGDAVFFERGDLWRGEYLLCREGVTYSAYGKGAKPVFTLSPEDGASSDKWTLYDQDPSGKKIWKFYRNMYDCGNLYFNGGESWAYKVAPHWRKGRWMNSDGTNFDMKKQLDSNHEFFSCIDSGLPKTNKVEYIWYPDYITDGPLYLRCDEGNPGKVFDSIEFGCRGKGSNGCFLELQTGCTVDNLCIRYVGTGGISPGNSDCIIQNCEIGWCGGAMLSDNGHELFAPDKDIVNVCGGGMSLGGHNNVMMNNYIHDTFQEGITLEGDYAGQQYNNKVNKNLIERANYGILIVHWNMDENAEPFWNDVDISDNIISMSGFSWGNTQGTQGYPMGSGLDITEHPNTNRNLRIHDNLFLGSYGWMFICQLPVKNLPEIYDNTFCTLTMSSLPFINRNYIQYPAGQTEKYMSTKFGNKTNKVIVLN